MVFAKTLFTSILIGVILGCFYFNTPKYDKWLWLFCKFGFADAFMQIEDMNNNRLVRLANYDAKLCKQVKNNICSFDHSFFKSLKEMFLEKFCFSRFGFNLHMLNVCLRYSLIRIQCLFRTADASTCVAISLEE